MSIGATQKEQSQTNPISNMGTSNQSKAKTQISIGTESKVPEEYYRPDETPLFKKLQKNRLTKTRTKQLLRAAERDFNDPPPPPGLGDCCGSSCDPCVRDLWKEEIGIWRERWGEWAEEKGNEAKEKEKVEESNGKQEVQNLGKVTSRGVKKTLQKELEW